MLLSKLSGSVRDKCSRHVLTICRSHEREPDLIDFIHFVNDETLIVKDLIFSKETFEQCIDKKSNGKGPKRHPSLHRVMVKSELKRNQMIAHTAMKIMNWMAAKYSWTKH